MIEACRYEPRLHASYQEMATHYGTVIIPARPRRPKDNARLFRQTRRVRDAAASTTLARRASDRAERWLAAALGVLVGTPFGSERLAIQNRFAVLRPY